MVSASFSNFGLIGFIVSEIVRFLYFGILAWNCLLTSTFKGFGVIFSPNDVIYRPQKAPSCAETRLLSHQARKSVQRFDLGACPMKKGQDSQKTSQKCYISPTWEEAPTEPICTKICTVVAVPGVCKVLNWKFQGLRFYRDRICDFLL